VVRIAFISDIHGNLPALDAVLADIAARNVELIVNLGDIVSGPLWPLATAQRLMALDLPTIRGNHERQLLTLPHERMGASDAFAAATLGEAEREWLRSLPATRWLSDDVLCCHGTPGSDLQYFLESVMPDFGMRGSPGIRAASAGEVSERLGDGADAALVACGHTHVPRIMRAECGTLIVNPGSVGLQAYDDHHPHRHVVETGSPHARWALVERGSHGEWSAALQATAYDWNVAARRAHANGRDDWAGALATGFFPRR